MPTFDEFFDAVALLIRNSDEPYFGLGSLLAGSPADNHVEMKVAEVYVACLRKHAVRRIANRNSSRT